MTPRNFGVISSIRLSAILFTFFGEAETDMEARSFDDIM